MLSRCLNVGAVPSAPLSHVLIIDDLLPAKRLSLSFSLSLGPADARHLAFLDVGPLKLGHCRKHCYHCLAHRCAHVEALTERQHRHSL